MKHIKKYSNLKSYTKGLEDLVTPKISQINEYEIIFDKSIDNNIIKYVSDTKLTETTSSKNAGLHTNVFTIISHSFDNNTNIGTIENDGNITEIGTYAFYKTPIKNIRIPNSVTSIDSYAFYNCTSLASIEIPDSVTSIGYDAFSGCQLLENFNFPIFLTSIGSYAFNECKSLKNVKLYDSVTIIDTNAFNGCKSLKNVRLSNSLQTINTNAFNGCESLENIYIPQNVTNIGEPIGTTLSYNPWQACKNIKSIKVDLNNSSYDSRNNCNAIINSSTNKLITGCKNTIIPNSVTKIGAFAFYCCTELTSINMSNNITSIEQHAFCNCVSLTGNIELPSTITSIGDNAFCNCNLNSITIYATNPPTLGTNVFIGENTFPIYVPSEAIDTYKEATNWSTYANRIQAITE